MKHVKTDRLYTRAEVDAEIAAVVERAALRIDEHAAMRHGATEVSVAGQLALHEMATIVCSIATPPQRAALQAPEPRRDPAGGV